MSKSTATTAAAGKTTYTYNVVVEPDENAWHVHCPALQSYGAATWGRTRAEALRRIRKVVALVIAEMIEDGERGSGGSEGQCRRPRFLLRYERN